MVRTAAEIKKILKEYKKKLEAAHIRVNKLLLYGSYASGTAHPYSDIDVVVVSADLAKFSPLKRQEFLALQTKDVDAPLEVIGYTADEYRLRKGTIFGQILNQTAKAF